MRSSFAPYCSGQITQVTTSHLREREGQRTPTLITLSAADAPWFSPKTMLA